MKNKKEKKYLSFVEYERFLKGLPLTLEKYNSIFVGDKQPILRLLHTPEALAKINCDWMLYNFKTFLKYARKKYPKSN
jgi:hypothetical protein